MVKQLHNIISLITNDVLQVQVSVGEKMIAAYATGTAVLLSVLPTPPEIALATHSRAFLSHQKSKKRLDEVSKLIEDTIKQNKFHYQLIEVCADQLHDISSSNSCAFFYECILARSFQQFRRVTPKVSLRIQV